MISIVKAIVTNIVANCSNDKTQNIKLIQIINLSQKTFRQHPVNHLCYIGTMQIVVVLNISVITQIYVI